MRACRLRSSVSREATAASQAARSPSICASRSRAAVRSACHTLQVSRSKSTPQISVSWGGEAD